MIIDFTQYCCYCSSPPLFTKKESKGLQENSPSLVKKLSMAAILRPVDDTYTTLYSNFFFGVCYFNEQCFQFHMDCSNAELGEIFEDELLTPCLYKCQDHCTAFKFATYFILILRVTPFQLVKFILVSQRAITASLLLYFSVRLTRHQSQTDCH